MWIFLALSASLVWGITYVLNEQIYKHISVLSSVAISFLISGFVMTCVALASGNFSKDIETILSSNKILLLVGFGALMLTCAEILIGFSIANKNATIAALIEISYPIFVALFSYLLFRENQISFATAVGAVLVFAGVGIIYVFNR